MQVPLVGHALDEILPVLGDVHLDTAGHTQAPRSLRRPVDLGESLLQPRILRIEAHTLDEESLAVHGSEQLADDFAQRLRIARQQASDRL